MEPVIDLRVPLLHNPTVISVETVEVIDGVFGGMGGGMKDTQTNMQEGETKRRDLPKVLQEGESTDQLQVPIYIMEVSIRHPTSLILGRVYRA